MAVPFRFRFRVAHRWPLAIRRSHSVGAVTAGPRGGAPCRTPGGRGGGLAVDLEPREVEGLDVRVHHRHTELLPARQVLPWGRGMGGACMGRKGGVWVPVQKEGRGLPSTSTLANKPSGGRERKDTVISYVARNCMSVHNSELRLSNACS